MDKYIKAVLAADGKVIIPRFGCIIEPSDEPGTLSFNPYLNFDDGKLTAAISAGEGLDTQNASYKISDTVDDYNNTLSDGGTVTISGIGSFHKDEDGRVEFTQSADFVHGDGDISLGMGIGMAMAEESTAAAAEPEQTPEPEPQPEPAPEPEPVAEPEPAQEPEPEETEEPEPVVVAEEPEYQEPVQKEEKKSRWPLVLLVILLVLIIIWLLLFVFFKDNAVYRYFCGAAAPAPTEQVAPAPADTTVAKKDTVEAAPAPVAKPKPEKKAPTEARALEHRYNVIVGSYKDEAVAIKRVRELQDKGFDDAFVGIKKEYYVAVIKDFANLTQAEAYQEEIVDGPYHIESWITNSGEND